MADRVALVTGSGGGIGTALCAELDGAGFEVVGADLSGADVEVDLRDGASCRAAVAAVLERTGRLDLLVNNAGINARGATEDMSEDVWGEVVDVNLKGTFRMCQAAFPALRYGGGAIVNLSSSAALVAIGGSTMYGVTKAAISHLTKILAVEWAPYGIRVNAVAPTIVESAMTADVLDDAGYMAAKMASIPLGRIATPGDVAAAVVWLAGERSAMTTGVTVPVDGGVSVL